MVKLQVLEESVAEAEDPAVDDGELVLGEALLDGRRLDDVPALLDDVDLDETIVLCVLVGNGVELSLVQAVDVADVSEPRVQQTQVLGRHGRLDTAAPVVSADDNVLDLEVADRVVNHGHDIQVDVVDQVGDVAVDEHLTGFEARDGFGGNARVGAAWQDALVGSLVGMMLIRVLCGRVLRRRVLCREGRCRLTNPQVLWALASAEAGEELWVLGLHLIGPSLVVLEDAVVGLLEVLAHLLGVAELWGSHFEV